jgi:hypothetical protein
MVQHYGWTALGNITVDDAGNAASASAAGDAEAALATLKRRRPAEACVLAGACYALGSLTHHCADRAADAGASGAIKAVVAALR